MSEGSNWVERLYSRFILRDILGRAIPGYVLLLFLGTIPSFSQHDALYVVVLFGVSFAIGVLLVQLGILFRITRIHVWPPTSGIFVKQGSVERESSLEKYSSFLKENERSPYVLQQRERLVVFKTASASYAMVTWLVFFERIARNFITGQQNWGLLAVALIAIVITWSNRQFAEEQRIWEELNTPEPKRRRAAAKP